MRIVPPTVVILLAIVISGCATPPKEATNNPLPAAKLLDLEGARKNSEKIGIALAGGGTKAAAYSMGVLAAVAKSDEELARIDAISSVSGGSYASLFLFSKLLLQQYDEKMPKISEFFADCIPYYYKKQHRLPESYSQESIPPLCSEPSPKKDKPTIENDKYRFQQYVRCRQDVFENDCKPDDDKLPFANTAEIVAETVGVIAPNFIARTVFDWPVNYSPSRLAYERGIWTTYGLYPLSIVAAGERSDIEEICDAKHFLNCDRDTILDLEQSKSNDPKILGFDQLNKLHKHRQFPTWLINATASRKRSLLGWTLSGQRDFSQYTLQMSPFGARSGRYGDIKLKDLSLTPLEAVTASAGFLDANETAVNNRPARLILAALSHLFAFDWGRDIDNPNVDPLWRDLHNVLPIPLYYGDGLMRFLGGEHDEKTRSSYIRLLDGGNNDDLGAFTLIEAGMKTIFISDNAQDSAGKMKDLCYLHNEVRKRTDRKLIIPGLEGLSNHCLNYASESEDEHNGDSVPGVVGLATEGHYSIRDWKYKVLVGCIRKQSDRDNCDTKQGEELDIKIFLLKPAINLDEFKEKYIDVNTHRIKPDACSQTEPGLCEVSAYLIDSYNPREKDHGLEHFPQDGTISITFASDSRRYGAYRELGRWQMEDALKLSKDQKLFDQALRDQTGKKISYDMD